MPNDAGVKVGYAKVIRTTEKAILVDLDGEERWVPQSCVHADSEVWKEGQEGELVLTRWFADKEGLG
jgi:hypothetical protein